MCFITNLNYIVVMRGGKGACLLMFCVVALSSGGVLELPWMLLDPRRPLSSTPELREEPVIPYMPELPTLPEAIINYNQTMFRVRGIHTSPSGLESTCLVFVYGLGQYTTYKCCLTKLLLCVKWVVCICLLRTFYER